MTPPYTILHNILNSIHLNTRYKLVYLADVIRHGVYPTNPFYNLYYIQIFFDSMLRNIEMCCVYEIPKIAKVNVSYTKNIYILHIKYIN